MINIIKTRYDVYICAQDAWLSVLKGNRTSQIPNAIIRENIYCMYIYAIEILYFTYDNTNWILTIYEVQIVKSLTITNCTQNFENDRKISWIKSYFAIAARKMNEIIISIPLYSNKFVKNYSYMTFWCNISTSTLAHSTEHSVYTFLIRYNA